MTTVFMLARHLWSFQLPDCDHEFFKTCGEAVRALIDNGESRRDISIDYETSTAATRARETAKRFIAAYGVNGAKFMPDGRLPAFEECPPRPGGIEEHRAMRKAPRVCPHCGKPIRPKDWK